MARKTICDRCGNEITPRSLFKPNGKPYDVVLKYEYQRYGYGQKRWDLCYDCAKALREFMNNPDHFAVIGDEDFEDEDCEV